MKEKENVTIRKAEKSDLARIAEVHRASILEIGPLFYAPDIIAVWGRERGMEGYQDALEKMGETYFLAEEFPYEPLLGFSSHICKNDEHHLAALYVRGANARKGIGKKLLSVVEDFARRQGAQHLHVEGTLSGEDFYRATGFAEKSRGGHSMSDGTKTVSVDVIHMVKKL